MSPSLFKYQSDVPLDAEVLFAWHLHPAALRRLSPPWQPVHILHQEPLKEGAKLVLKTPIPNTPFWTKWTARHLEVHPPDGFTDIQEAGPFKIWQHEHRFIAHEQGTRMEDSLRYQMPFPSLLHPIFGRKLHRQFEQSFAYRHAVLARDVALFQLYEATPKRVLISGGSGLVGSALIPFLETMGFEVWKLVRRNPHEKEIQWDPYKQIINPRALEDFDAVIHLSGENVGKRWTKRTKRKIWYSRTISTTFLAQTLAKLKRPPEVFISASGAGFYGETALPATEEHGLGHGFLADVCEAWEQSTLPAKSAGIRVINARFGLILSPAGGALQKMLPVFLNNVGGKIGTGEQMMSWISIDDVLGIFYHLLHHNLITGAINVVSPNAVSNLEFSQTLAHVLARPCFMSVPRPIVGVLFGQMGKETLLQSQNVYPERLLAQSYPFMHPQLEDALRHVLGRRRFH